jgi:hypothetical protein
MNAAAIALAFLLAQTVPQYESERSSERGDDPKNAYRRGFKEGFDEGYRKGIEEADKRAAAAASAAAAAAAEASKPRPTGPIMVTRAIYGPSSGGGSCDATRWVARKANGQRSASVDVTNNMCGDPAPGKRKSLEITYICGAMVKEASAFEHRSAYLDCTS